MPTPTVPIRFHLEAHNVVVTNGFNWQGSWLGNYYLPTNSTLINTGSTNANLLGLYHFTSQTNQVKETNSVVDIGYHYVATDAYGNPLDSNSDGIPDYIEDGSGTNWALAILVQPTNLLANQGTSPAFTVAAAGIRAIALSVVFQLGVAVWPNQHDTDVHQCSNQQCAGSYCVVVTNNFGAITSSVVTLAVVVTPTILITNPVNNAVFIASPTNITLNATASDIAGTISQVNFFRERPAWGSPPIHPTH